jgi:hypothetical protein
VAHQFPVVMPAGCRPAGTADLITVYFSNDGEANAVRNVRTLRALLSE